MYCKFIKNTYRPHTTESKEERCKKCDGYGIEWDEMFERGIDTVIDT